MHEVLAAALAAGVSFLINTRAVKKWGDRAITYLSPVVEEAAKTVSAYSLGAGIFTVHIMFGLIEAVLDIRRLRPFTGFLSAIAGIVSHSVFGYITVAGFKASGRLVTGAALALSAHMLWNVIVVSYADKRNT